MLSIEVKVAQRTEQEVLRAAETVRRISDRFITQSANLSRGKWREVVSQGPEIERSNLVNGLHLACPRLNSPREKRGASARANAIFDCSSRTIVRKQLQNILNILYCPCAGCLN